MKGDNCHTASVNSDKTKYQMKRISDCNVGSMGINEKLIIIKGNNTNKVGGNYIITNKGGEGNYIITNKGEGITKL